MHRFYLPPEQTLGNELVLDGREAHHAVEVLRLRPGDQVQVLDGAGLKCACTIRSIDKRIVRLEPREREVAPLPDGQIILAQALPKGKTMDLIVQKASELGASQILPLVTERTEVHLERTEKIATKVDKWRAVAVESIKQCGSLWLPQIHAPLALNAFLSSPISADCQFVASLGQGCRHLRHYWEDYRLRYGRAPRRICLLIGPEGDLSPAELAQAERHGFRPVSFGALILRCETAAIYGLSILNHELQYSLTKTA